MTRARSSLWSLPESERPRERLKQLGPAALSPTELVALVLGSGLAGVNVLESAESLLEQAGGIRELLGMTVRELTSLKGVGSATAGRIVAVSELWRRVDNRTPGVLVEKSQDVFEAAAPCFSQRNISRFGASVVVVADEELRLQAVVPLKPNTEHQLEVHIARILHEVLYRGGAAFAIVQHRLPDQQEDPPVRVHLTHDRIRLAALTVGVQFLDYLLVTGSGPSATWVRAINI